MANAGLNVAEAPKESWAEQGRCAMTTAAATVGPIAWWKEPTKDQWYGYVASWAGWTLDAFDFTAFLLIMAPIAKEFDVPVPEVAAVLALTLWMRLFSAPPPGGGAPPHWRE